VRLTAHAGFGGRLHGLAVQPTLRPLRHGVMGVLFGGTLWSSSPFVLVFCCLPLQRTAAAAVSSRVPVTPDRSVVPAAVPS
jgi:hypothetical protein